MGFGGQTSLIGCKIGALNRLPASFFVSVAYDCWAFRRLGVRLDAGDRRDHQVALSRRRDAVGADAVGRSRGRRLPAHRPRDSAAGADQRGAGARAQGRRRRADLRAAMFTGRDAVHAHLMKHEPPVDLNGARALSLRAGRGEGRQRGRRLAGHGGRSDHQHPRGAVSGRDHQALRRAGGDRQGRHGGEDAGRAGRRRAPSISTRSAARRSSTRAASSASPASR